MHPTLRSAPISDCKLPTVIMDSKRAELAAVCSVFSNACIAAAMLQLEFALLQGRSAPPGVTMVRWGIAHVMHALVRALKAKAPNNGAVRGLCYKGLQQLRRTKTLLGAYEVTAALCTLLETEFIPLLPDEGVLPLGANVPQRMRDVLCAGGHGWDVHERGEVMCGGGVSDTWVGALGVGL